MGATTHDSTKVTICSQSSSRTENKAAGDDETRIKPALKLSFSLLLLVRKNDFGIKNNFLIPKSFCESKGRERTSSMSKDGFND
jgi:hypothetical protein